MGRKLLSAVVALLVAFGSFFASAPPVSAAYTGNLAGKPCAYINIPGAGCGDNDTTCHSVIYGRVNNQMVLFLPQHCFWTPGQTIYGPGGIVLGQQAADYANISASDMAFVWLGANGNYPTSNRNVIYTGDGGSWTNTNKWGVGVQDCDSIDTMSGYVQASHWYDLSPPSGDVNQGFVEKVFQDGAGYYGVGKRCRVWTSLPYPGTAVPSGAPWRSTTYGFIPGVSTGHGNATLLGDTYYFTSWYQAIRDLNAYASGGAWFCANSACT